MCELYERVEREGIAKGIAKGIEKGIAKGQAEGRAAGKAEGAKDILMLMQKLFAAGRVADAEKASNDRAYCDKLLAEFGLAN